MHRMCLVAGAVTAILGNLLAHNAWAIASELIGNQPLSELNYTEWKGIMPLVNDKARVYENWANGNERLFYKGTTKELNAALAHFAKMEVEHHVVVLRPGPAVQRSFDRQAIPYNWELHVIGGLARRHATRDKKDLQWLRDPVLTVYVGGDIDLEKLDIPKELSVVAKSDENQEHEATQRKIDAFLEARKRAAQK